MKISKLSLFKDKTKHPRWKGGKLLCPICKSSEIKRNSKSCVPCYKKKSFRENSSNWKGGNSACKNCKMKTSSRNTSLCRKCSDVHYTADKAHAWRGGVTPINAMIRTSPEYKLWRESVFKRDNFTCVWCGLKSGNGSMVVLHADHIKSFSQFPALRFAIDNGRTLCIGCHKTTDTYAGKGRIKNNKNKND